MIIYYITNTFFCLIQMLALFLNLTPKYNKYLSFIIAFIPFSAAAMSQRALSFINPIFLVALAHIIFFVTAFAAFKDSIKIKLYISLSVLGILYLGTLLTMPIAYSFGSIDAPDSPSAIVDIIISVLLMFAFTAFYRMKKDDVAFAKFSIIEFSVVVIAQLICVFAVMMILNEDKVFAPEKILAIFGKNSSVAVGFLVASGALFLVSDFALLLLMVKEAKSGKLKDELALSEYKNRMNLEYYKTIEKNIEETRKIRHDLANIVQIAYGMIKTGDAEESGKILNMLSNSIKNIHIEKYAKNTLINTILSIKAQTCRERNVTFDFDVSLPEKTGIDEIDICKAFVNLIDNAINAAAQSEKKYIEVKSHIENGEIYVAVLNSCVSGQGSGIREKDKNHGFGQKILSDIAKVYKGRFVTEQNDCEYRAVLALKAKI